MAKASDDLVERLHMGGIRRKVAEGVAAGVNGARGGRKQRSAAAKNDARTRAKG